MEISPANRFEPLGLWMAREGLNGSDLLRAERAGAPLPVWVRPDGSVFVDRTRLPSWREVARLLGVIPAAPGPGGAP